MPLVGYLIWVAEAAIASPQLNWALLLALWTLGALLLGFWLARGGASHFLNCVERNASPITLGMIIVAALCLISVSLLQAHFFAISANAEDTAYYSQLLWNTLHGRFLSGNVQQERLYNPPVSSDLALHVSPILIVGLLPIYALFPHFLTLLIVRDVVLVAAAWPLFLIARERMNGTAGVAAAFLYLANPAVIAQGVEAFYLLQLAPLPFFFALRAFLRDEFGRFLSWMALCIAMREDVAITMAGFGLWALVKRRQLKWLAVSLGLPLVWWGLATLLIQPAFGRSANSALDVALADGSQTPLGIYQVLLGKPSWVVDALREGGLNYLYRLLRSVGFLSILGLEGLVAAPGLAATLFLGRVFYSGSDPNSRFALLSSCALIGAAVLVVSKIGKRYAFDLRAFALIMLVLLPSVSLLDGVKDAIQERLLMYTVRNDAVALREAIRRIPDSASVAAPNYALPALGSRPKLFYVSYLFKYAKAQPDYVLLDHNFQRVTANPELREQYVKLVSSLSNSTEYQTTWRQGAYSLLRRKETKWKNF